VLCSILIVEGRFRVIAGRWMSSTVLTPRLSLHRRCSVEMRAPGMLQVQSSATVEEFVCMYHFDHEAISLTPLPGL
jgi:hypothetical protein